jgi:Family of unknown function (DUF6502)
MTNDQASWAQNACYHLLRPVVRLALGMGLKHKQLDELLRSALLDQARQSWEDKGILQPNISQLSVTTGLNRKEVTDRVRRDEGPLLAAGESAASKTLTAWLQLLAQDPSFKTLPLMAASGEQSFEKLAREATRGNVHQRAVLEELVRLGMVNRAGDSATLAVDGFVPTRDLRSMLALLGDNAGDHLQAGVHNTLGTGPQPFLERSVFANGLDEGDCKDIQDMARDFWSFMHKQLVTKMNRAVENTQGKGSQRMRVGIYTYYENDLATPPAAAANTSGTAQPQTGLPT